MVQLVRDIEARCPALELVGILAVGLKQSLMAAMDAACSSIGKPFGEILSFIHDVSDDLGFVIDDNFLVLKNDDFGTFVSHVDKYFAEWTSKEKVKRDTME